LGKKTGNKKRASFSFEEKKPKKKRGNNTTEWLEGLVPEMGCKPEKRNGSSSPKLANIRRGQKPEGPVYLLSRRLRG